MRIQRVMARLLVMYLKVTLKLWTRLLVTVMNERVRVKSPRDIDHAHGDATTTTGPGVVRGRMMLISKLKNPIINRKVKRMVITTMNLNNTRIKNVMTKGFVAGCH